MKTDMPVISLLTLLILVLDTANPSCAAPLDTMLYMSERETLIVENEQMRLGGSLQLSELEQRVNEVIMKEKRDLIENSRLNSSEFMPSMSFFHSKPQMEKTKTYQIIHNMPKGAALHLHDQSMVSPDWIIKNVTYRDNLYMCQWQGQLCRFKFFNASAVGSDCQWKSVQAERAAASDVKAFDLSLKNNISLLVQDPFLAFADNQAAWSRFSRFFGQIYAMMTYLPVYRDMFWRTLEEFREGNVQYVEVRGDFSGLYELNGTVYNAEFGVQLVRQIVQDFVKRYPDFSGAKIIFCGIRNQDLAVVLGQVKTSINLHKKYPDVFIGYDLGGNEAAYKPLAYFTEALLYPSRQEPPYNLPYFFHAGETNWQGTAADYNLVDALLLNTTRIGHGFALPKHPRLAQMVRERGIALEVEPVSNQMLRLVDDLRNHPITALMAEGYPVVICTDDRTSTDMSPLSHDFYLAFMAMSSEDADLTFLKQLAINSLKYSAMEPTEKETALKLWQEKWDRFIKETIQAI
ncbi:adenosine deaminase AGSA-like [Physella acuta]|uniref:adenosine deaminase AGSA-like n=1 Tax=Physella acuta TaxID=109671 RepID=UPI0027DDC8B4|nr:adenosine deaminase AGSA-like [Physella acuta]XP_059164004.1 adenosine deaminase AGSA-like [Physella acuta]